MPRIHDLRCQSCGYLEQDALLRDLSGDTRPCDKCAGTMHITFEFAGRRTLPADGFVPFDLDGVHYGTREEWHARRAQMARNMDEDPANIQVVANDRRGREQRYEEAQQRHINNLRSKGMDLKEWRERVEHAKHHQ